MLQATRQRNRFVRERWVVRFCDVSLPSLDRFVLELLEARILLTRDPGDLVTYDPGSIIIDSGPPYILTSGTSVDHVALATFQAPANIQYQAVTDWGDGTSQVQPIFALNNGSFAVIGSHDYAGASGYDGRGEYDVNTTITASDGSSDDTSATIVTRVDGMKLIEDPEIDTSLDRNTSENSVVRFLDSDPVADSDYKVTIDWGDGTRSAGWVQTSTWGTHDVHGDHFYERSGTFPLTVTISRAGQTITSVGNAMTWDGALADVHVVDGPRYIPLDGTRVKDQVFTTFWANLPSDQFTDQYSATVDWDDGSTSSAKVISTGEGQYSVVGSHEYASKDVFGLDIQVLAKGLPDPVIYDTRYILTRGDPIELVDGPGFRTYKSEKPQPFFVASFVDRDPLEGEQYDVTIDWGDGTRANGEALNRGFGVFDIEASHAFATTGSYRMSLTITRGGETFLTEGPIEVLDTNDIIQVPEKPLTQLDGPDEQPSVRALTMPRRVVTPFSPLDIHFATIADQVFDSQHSIKIEATDDGAPDPLA
jgi:hypothetical protein